VCIGGGHNGQRTENVARHKLWPLAGNPQETWTFVCIHQHCTQLCPRVGPDAQARAGDCCLVCTHSSTDTAANPSSTRLQLIALHGLGLVKPSTCTEAHQKAHEHEPEQSGRSLRGPAMGWSPRTYCVYTRFDVSG
jgi:hypothetical protein